MQIIDLIAAKRDGAELSGADLREFTKLTAAGEAPDYQVAAWLMAAYIQGLSLRETTALAMATRDSGTVLGWDAGPPTADKHSTGGVGDKISLILAPLAAASGLRVPMISGRSLGHTGGTLDKLESIPGMKVDISLEMFRRLVEKNGLAMCGQTGWMAPADRKLYALRDATGTVSSIPLICASILGKKLAENTDVLVFDVKAGSGAFMKTDDEAEELASVLVKVAGDAGIRAEALITSMDFPLGLKAGNMLEVQEALDVLKGGGPDDVRELTIRLVASMLQLAFPGRFPNDSQASLYCRSILDGGAALDKFIRMIEAQGGDLAAFEKLPAAPVIYEIRAERSGRWGGVDAFVLGESLRGLGAGRYGIDHGIDPAVGWEQLVRPGTDVHSGDSIGLIHARNKDGAGRVAAAVSVAFAWNAPDYPLIRKVM